MHDNPTNPGCSEPCAVRGVLRITLWQHAGVHGSLAVLGQGAADLPFTPKRVFLTYGATGSRGRHAHRGCAQVLICTAGRLRVRADDGRRQEEFLLCHPHQALYIPPMVWTEQFDHSEDAVLLVLASHPFDSADYLHNRDEWLAQLDRQEHQG